MVGVGEVTRGKVTVCSPVPRSFSYMDSYNHDIRFDNVYISTYFCQIDERRKKLVGGHSPVLLRGCLAVCPVQSG